MKMNEIPIGHFLSLGNVPSMKMAINESAARFEKEPKLAGYSELILDDDGTTGHLIWISRNGEVKTLATYKRRAGNGF